MHVETRDVLLLLTTNKDEKCLSNIDIITYKDYTYKKCSSIDIGEQKHVYIHYDAYDVSYITCIIEDQKKYLLVKTSSDDNDNFYLECDKLESYTEVYEHEEEWWTPCGGPGKKSWETIEVQYDVNDFENFV